MKRKCPPLAEEEGCNREKLSLEVLRKEKEKCEAEMVCFRHVSDASSAIINAANAIVRAADAVAEASWAKRDYYISATQRNNMPSSQPFM
jgi:hypothetical protein